MDQDPGIDPAPAQTVFVLSPARCGGKRAEILLSERASFPLAVQLREAGAPIGEIFSFLSGLYFRGKLTYSRSFRRVATERPGILVITPGRGLIAPEEVVSVDDLREI